MVINTPCWWKERRKRNHPVVFVWSWWNWNLFDVKNKEISKKKKKDEWRRSNMNMAMYPWWSVEMITRKESSASSNIHIDYRLFITLLTSAVNTLMWKNFASNQNPSMPTSMIISIQLSRSLFRHVLANYNSTIWLKQIHTIFIRSFFFYIF